MSDVLQEMVNIKRMAEKVATFDERTRILYLIDQLIIDTEDCPLYEGGGKILDVECIPECKEVNKCSG